MTNWEELRAECEYREMPLMDETGPQRVLEALRAAGIEGTEKEGLVFLPKAPWDTRDVACIAASELFTSGELYEAYLKRRRAGRIVGAVDLFMAKAVIVGELNPGFRGLAAHLYVLDLDNGLADSTNQAIAQTLEVDMRLFRKFVCTPAEMLDRLGNPFGSMYEGGYFPRIEIQRVDHLSFEPAPLDFAETVPRPFVGRGSPEAWHEELQQHPEAVRLTALANRLVARIFGRDFELQAADSDVLLLRGGARNELPWFALANGEQFGLAFCSYLALMSVEATEDSWIGFTDVLTYLDSSRYLLFLDVLQDFILATGSNVYLRANKSDYRELAERKLSAVQEILRRGPSK